MDDMSREDLQRSYEGSWLGVRNEDGSITPFFVAHVTSDKEFIDNDQVLHYQDPTIVYDYPDLGYISTSQGVLWCEREPARQYIRGVRPNLFKYYDAATGRSGNLRETRSDFCRTLLKKVYNPEYSNAVARFACRVNDVYYYRGLRVCKVQDLDKVTARHVATYIGTMLGE